jgi:hypothetical protein
VPFFTPRGGIVASFALEKPCSGGGLPAVTGVKRFGRTRGWEYRRHQATEGDEMYIGGGFLALILIILLLIWLF